MNKWIKRIAVAAFLVLPVNWISNALVEHAIEERKQCTDDYSNGPDLEHDCSGAKVWLVLPEIVPWTHRAAADESATIDRLNAARRLDVATSFAPDDAARERAIAGVLADDDPDALVSSLRARGAARAAIRKRARLTTANAQMQWLRAALDHGDIDEAIAFAKDSPALEREDYFARELYFVLGSLACLGGDETKGRRLLHDAMRINDQHHPFPFYEARVALAACGEIIDVPRGETDWMSLQSFALAKASDDDVERLFRETGLHDAGSPFVAEMMARKPRSTAETVPLVAHALEYPIHSFPWENPRPYPQPYPMRFDPETYERAASRLETLAGPLPSLPASEDRFSASEPVMLRRIARSFWISAGDAWSRQAECGRAEEAMRHAHALFERPDQRLGMAAALARCDRWAHAAELASNTTGVDRDALALAAIRIQALAHDGKFDDARVLAEASLATFEGWDPEGIDEANQARAGIEYLALAMELATHSPVRATIPAPKILEHGPRSWDAVVSTPEKERAILRWGMLDFGGLLVSTARPAELFVVASAAPPPGAEVWLDRAAPPMSSGGVVHMRARAEAARWRGDATAEAAWRDRAAKTQRFFKGPNASILAKLAGL